MELRLKEKIEKVLLKVQNPAKYIGGEINQVVKKPNEVDLRFAFCFPDTYEIGMSHLGMKILYSILNDKKDTWCERVFAPWLDFEKEMVENDIPMYSLESYTPLHEFDIVAFTLQYELSYTNVLNMLSLGEVNLLAKDRNDLKNIVIAGGPCTCNPEPLADFVDIFCLGEGEEVLPTICDIYIEAKKNKLSKLEFLKQVSKLKGVYVPSFYEIEYKQDGTILKKTPLNDAPEIVEKSIIEDFDKVVYPKNFIVPFVDVVHDRAVIELMRGCIRGCRFCQAGFIYRPLREKNAETLCSQGVQLCKTTGYEEISLCSLSTSDYSGIEALLDGLLDFTQSKHINLSLPSLRIDNFSDELLEKISRVRKSGLTFAPEAGTQRLRDAINKNITESDILKSCTIAFKGGYTSVKLYFMLGLPTETLEDIEGIIVLAQKVVDLYYNLSDKPKGRNFNVSVSVSNFVPKPFTPFQFEPQDTLEMINQKQKHLLSFVKSKKIRLSWHDAKTSVLEGAFARGDRRLGKVILKAWQDGCRFDSWEECFNFEKWQNAFSSCGLNIDFYANRKREYDEILPWDHINFFISKDFLIKEHKKAMESKTTKNCRENCSNCGANKLIGGKCFD